MNKYDLLWRYIQNKVDKLIKFMCCLYFLFCKKYLKPLSSSIFELFNLLPIQLFKSFFQIVLLLNFYSLSFADYSRIVSLAPSVTESLYELEINKELVANTIYCKDNNCKREKVGTVTEPNIEKIVSLKPDLVVATKEGNYQSVVDKLKRLKLNVFIVEQYSGIEDIYNNFQVLADYIGKKELAQQIIKETKEEIKKISEIEKNNNEKIFWEVGANPLFSVGNKSFINDYNKFINGTNIFEKINMSYPNINIESVLEKNPDIIILVNMGDVSTKEINKWKKYKNITAVKNKKIFVVEADDIFIPTPKGFLKGIQKCKALLENY